ncbi:hypothetical protein HGRIS_003426 [Hohenbuehelia grisea]|uniref:MFS general substrate transporter n=1 Tax=Hohenbuehelia grisea TaxID=104357 RepID=A0ABR3JG75_9AGAR
MSVERRAAVDPLASTGLGAFSPSRAARSGGRGFNSIADHQVDSSASEQQPLLETNSPRKKRFYRARPLWMLPFAFTAALVRGMTLAPRVQVFTELSRSALLHQNHGPACHSSTPNYSLALASDRSFVQCAPLVQEYSHPLMLQPLSLRISDMNSTHNDMEALSSLPPQCPSESEIQAGAAKIQTIVIITMGSLSAISNGWWGHFGERHGRTKVLALATIGLFITDTVFVLVSKTPSLFPVHGDKLLYITAILEGLLGGTSTIQSTTAAYISDCTSAGSRAHIFSRFTGVFFLGISIGPAIGGWLIRNSAILPLLKIFSAPSADKQSVTPVFFVATICSFINLFFVLFVFPESLSEQKQAAARREFNGERQKKSHVTVMDAGSKGKGRATVEVLPVQDDDIMDDIQPTIPHDRESRIVGPLRRLVAPLAIFLPASVPGRQTLHTRKDWSLTFLAVALFGHMLSTGIFQIKYLYATHVYGWTSEQLSYYISVMGGSRAFNLLVVLPFIIATFKPKLGDAAHGPASHSRAGNVAVNPGQQSNIGHLTGNNIRYTNPPPIVTPKPKPKLTKAHLAREIQFDLNVARASLIIDVISQTSVVLSPSPLYDVNRHGGLHNAFARHSVALFVVATGLSSFGSGMLPAVQSLALCIVQARALDEENAEHAEGQQSDPPSSIAVGKLFGAIATLQAVGQMTLGPLMFGLIYSNTVGTFPKAVFATAACILSAGLASILLVQAPVVPKGKRRRTRDESLAERGRSRVSKDLRRNAEIFGHFRSQQEEGGSMSGTSTSWSAGGPRAGQSSSQVQSGSSSLG